MESINKYVELLGLYIKTHESAIEDKVTVIILYGLNGRNYIKKYIFNIDIDIKL